MPGPDAAQNQGMAMPIAEEDLEYTFFRSSGPGGQKKNTTDSSVRLRHLPTGLVVIATASRSQFRNKEAALAELERRLALRARRKKPRVPTKATIASRRKRLEDKQQHAQTKRLRRTPGNEE